MPINVRSLSDQIDSQLNLLFGASSKPLHIGQLELDSGDTYAIGNSLEQIIAWLTEAATEPFTDIMCGKTKLSFEIGSGKTVTINNKVSSEIQSMADQFEKSMIDALTYYLNEKNKAMGAVALTHSLGQIFAGDMGSQQHLRNLATGKGKGQQGFGVMLEDIFLPDIGGGGNAPTMDSSLLNLEMKSTNVTNPSGTKINIGTAQFNIGKYITLSSGIEGSTFKKTRFEPKPIGASLSDTIFSSIPQGADLTKISAAMEQIMSIALVATFRIARKMRNLLYIENIFINTAGESIQAPSGTLVDMGGFILEGVYLYIGLLVTEVWKEVIKNFDSSKYGNPSMMDIKFKKVAYNEVKIEASFKRDETRDVELIAQGIKKNWERLYIRKINLIAQAKGTQGFRNALFGYLRHGTFSPIRLPKP